MHVPFCVVKCGYCDFNTFAGVPAAEMSQVLTAIDHEMASFAGLRPTTVFLGGGTPTHLEASLLERLLEAIATHFDLSGVVEFTCEANPESTTDDKVQLLVNNGVTRVSLGAQAFDASRLRFLDRAHGVSETRRAVDHVRAHAVDLNLDLIFATPGHAPSAWRRELDEAVRLEPDHLSCYGLTFEPGTRLHADLRRGLVQEASQEAARELLLQTRQQLREAGFLAYEVSNYARAGHECRHNLHYWRAGNYLGVGPGAASHFSGRRWTNIRSLNGYVSAIQGAGSGAASAETLDPIRRCREAIWLGLRLAEGADLARTSLVTGCDARALARPIASEQEAEGLAEWKADRLCVTERGFPLTDLLAAAYL